MSEAMLMADYGTQRSGVEFHHGEFGNRGTGVAGRAGGGGGCGRQAGALLAGGAVAHHAGSKFG